MIDNNIIHVVDFGKVLEYSKLYREVDSNVFIKFKDIIKDWNDIIVLDLKH